jgi:DNA transformation protein and related proteins
MAVSREYLEYVLDQLRCIGEVEWKRMFGGIGLYNDELFFGLIDDDVLYFKVDDQTRAGYLTAGAKPFDPYKDGNTSGGYYSVTAAVLEDVDELKRWAKDAVDAARRKAATKKPRKPGKKR